MGASGITRETESKFGQQTRSNFSSETKSSEPVLNQKSWDVLEKAAANRPPSPFPNKNTPERPPLAVDKAHRQFLLLQARLEGVKDLDRFQSLADYFESTVVKTEDKTVNVPKGLTPEQKKEVVEKWKTKGWEGDSNLIDEEQEGKNARLGLTRSRPLRLEGQHVKLMKQLMSAENNPVEIANQLQDLGFRFDEFTLGSTYEMEKLGELFTAPHISDALKLARGISTWSDVWFEDSHGALGQIEFLTQLAKHPDPTAAFPPEMVRQIDTLSRALNINVGVYEIGQFQTLIANPDKLDFVAYITTLGNATSYRQHIPIFQNITALDEAGVLKPMVELYRSGVSVGAVDQTFLTSVVSIRELFDSFEAMHKPQEVCQKVVAQMRDTLKEDEVQVFFRDTERREFVGTLVDLRGSLITIDELTRLDEMFGEDLERGDDAIYVLKLIQTFSDKKYSVRMSTLSDVIYDRELMGTFHQPDFPAYLLTLQEKTGYRIDLNDFFYGGYRGTSILGDIFKDLGLRQGLIDENTVAVIKALHPDGKFNIYEPQFYIRVGRNPRMVPTINALMAIGYTMPDYRVAYPDTTFLEDIANFPEIINKLESPNLRNLISRLKDQFGWNIGESDEILALLALHDDKKLQSQLFTPENMAFIKQVRPQGISLPELKPILDTPPAHRELLVQMVVQFKYHPRFIPNRLEDDLRLEVINKLLQDKELKTRVFSDHTLSILKSLQTKFEYEFEIADVITIANAPADLTDFIEDLVGKYQYRFMQRDLYRLIDLSGNREEFNSVVGILREHGYAFKAKDIHNISPLLPNAKSLQNLFSAVSQAFFGVGERRDGRRYVFRMDDVPYLIQLEPYLDRLPAAVAALREAMGYRFDLSDARHLASAIKDGNCTPDRLKRLKEITNKYKVHPSTGFNLRSIEIASIIEKNEGVITRLEKYNYRFDWRDMPNLEKLLGYPDQEALFRILDILKDSFRFSYESSLVWQYNKLAHLPDIENKLKQAEKKLGRDFLVVDENNFLLFVALNANSDLYLHAKNLLTGYLFNNIRDSENRWHEFRGKMFKGEIATEVIEKIFSVSSKATELDKLLLKYNICSQIAKAAGKDKWEELLLQSTDFHSAYEAMTKMMIEFSIPVIYSGLQKEELSAKQSELMRLASVDKEFDEILVIACRSVGIYGEEHGKDKSNFDILMDAIRQALELNIERDPNAYLEKRAKLSSRQFDRIFDDVPSETRERIMKFWLDLTPRRKLRVNGDRVMVEEETLSRLNRIKDIVNTDLSIHLEELFRIKVAELEAAVAGGETRGPRIEQLKIYKQYLMTPGGVIRQDIPPVYRSIKTLYKDAKAKLKSPETPKEEKVKLEKNCGTYEQISHALKAIYRLGTITESRYAARKDYLSEIEQHIGEFSIALKKLKILDSENRASNVTARALEEEVLLDFRKLKNTILEENVSGQTTFETETTVAFVNLAKAPEITESCQRLTEATGYNHAAYSRLLDGSNEMVDIFDRKNGSRNRLARSFIELSKVRVDGESRARLVVLLDRKYVSPEYKAYDENFSSEMMLHMLDRISEVPELSLVTNSFGFPISSPEVQHALRVRGYRSREISGEYFVNESNVRLVKYYDSLDGLHQVNQPSWDRFAKLHLVERF